MDKKIKRSPLFYVGDKYKLMQQLLHYFPQKINNFHEPFVGGGTVFLNVKAKKYYLNDIDRNLIGIHKFLVKSSKNPKKFFNDVEKKIHKYNLSRSYKEDVVPNELKKKWKKTYFAKFNNQGYKSLRDRVNKKNSKEDSLILYLLLIYGFNRMLRFNKEGRFNLPVGNVDFNKNVASALRDYFDFVKNKKILLSSKDFRSHLSGKNLFKNDFV